MTNEQVIAATPIGHRMTLLEAARAKRVLAMEGMTAADRVRLLEAINKMFDLVFTPAVLAVIEPADDVTVRIMREAASLDTADSHGMASYRLLTGSPTFEYLVGLNESLLDAMKLMRGAPWPATAA